MTLQAHKGDIIVFDSGLLTPQWVVKKLRGCEENLRSQKKPVQNTIVIVIDACYSGNWKTRMQRCLTDEPLQFTRVILQTSCGEDEVSYGGCFMPVFCDLQDTEKRKNLLGLYENEEIIDGIELLYDQTPTFYDSKATLTRPKEFYFPDNPFFEFCRKCLTIQHWTATRGIPNEELSDFFESFSSNSNRPEINCFRLTKMKKNNSPMAFFLIEWRAKKYHIHLHFDDIKKMNLTGVTHVKVMKNGGVHHHNKDGTEKSKMHLHIEDEKSKKHSCTEKPKGISFTGDKEIPVIGKPKKYSYTEKSEELPYTEDITTKEHITPTRDSITWHNLVVPNQEKMVTYFKNFAEKKLDNQWNKICWNMSTALPEDLIRSRSAHLEECIKMAKLKTLYEKNA